MTSFLSVVVLLQEETDMSRADNDALEARPQVAVLARALYREHLEEQGRHLSNEEVVRSFKYLMDHHQYPYLARAATLLKEYEKIHKMLQEPFDLNNAKTETPKCQKRK